MNNSALSTEVKTHQILFKDADLPTTLLTEEQASAIRKRWAEKLDPITLKDLDVSFSWMDIKRIVKLDEHSQRFAFSGPSCSKHTRVTHRGKTPKVKLKVGQKMEEFEISFVERERLMNREWKKESEFFAFYMNGVWKKISVQGIQEHLPEFHLEGLEIFGVSRNEYPKIWEKCVR